MDFHKRGKFFQKSVTEAHYLEVAKKIRNEIFEDTKTLFNDPDLKRRMDAFSDLKNLRTRYERTFQSLSDPKKKALIEAIKTDDRLIENALHKAKVTPYLELKTGHVPLIDAVSGKAFTLWDYLQDEKLLSEKMCTFKMHFSDFDPAMLSELLPGIGQSEILHSLKGKNPHLLFEAEHIQFDVQKSRKGVTIEGRCRLKDLSHLVKFEVPMGDLPGNINAAIDRILKE